MLVDAGLGAREVERRLEALGRGLGAVAAILLSHEHGDHVRGLDTITKLRRLLVVATAGTLRAVRRRLAPGTELLELPRSGETRLADLRVGAFPVPHDARQPVGFRLGCGDAELGHLTDFGLFSAAMTERLGGVTALVVESNHDVEMLRAGPYPPRLKKRILGPVGHVSNEATAEFLRRADLRRLRLLYLAHLSRTNNRPDLARAVAELALKERAVEARIETGGHDEPGPVEDGCGAPPGSRAPLQLRMFDAAPPPLPQRERML